MAHGCMRCGDVESRRLLLFAENVNYVLQDAHALPYQES